MANELKHKTVGTELTQAEFEGTDLHHCDSQATGDLVYASSATQLRRLAVGSTAQVLTVASGLPTWTTTTKVVLKTADETVNNSSTLQNDDHLILPLGANEVWIFQFFLFSNSSTTADIKIAFTAPTGAVFQYLISSADIGVDSSTTTATFARMSTGAINIYGESLDKLDILRGLVINGANAGNLQLQWAQSLAEVSDTIVRANSCLIATKIA